MYLYSLYGLKNNVIGRIGRNETIALTLTPVEHHNEFASFLAMTNAL